MRTTLHMRGFPVVECKSLADASAIFQHQRDTGNHGEGYGASNLPRSSVRRDGRRLRISYNGRIWANKEWASGDVPVYDPRS